jgi:hypothetical protein
MRKVVEHFVARLQRISDPPPDQLVSYLEVPASSMSQRHWERTQWIDGTLLERNLAGMLWTDSLEESPDIARKVLAEGVMRRTAPFVALVDRDGSFRGLVDRNALVSQVAKANADRASEENAHGSAS